MKKLLLLFSIPIYLLACKDDDKPTTANSTDCDTLTTEELKKFPVLNEADVFNMAALYNSLKHDSTNTIQTLTMNATVLRKLLRTKKSIRLISAAYTADSGSCKRGDITVVIQLWDKDGSKVYYDVRKVERSVVMEKVICPPPINCNINSQPSSD